MPPLALAGRLSDFERGWICAPSHRLEAHPALTPGPGEVCMMAPACSPYDGSEDRSPLTVEEILSLARQLGKGIVHPKNPNALIREVKTPGRLRWK